MAFQIAWLALWWRVLGRADETVVTDVKAVEQVLEICRHLVRQLARRHAQIARFLRHLQAVLVGSGLEPHLTPRRPFEIER